MNKEQLKGNWHILKGKIKEHWGRLTDDDLDVIDGEMEQLTGIVINKYGVAKDRVERELQTIVDRELENTSR